MEMDFGILSLFGLLSTPSKDTFPVRVSGKYCLFSKGPNHLFMV